MGLMAGDDFTRPTSPAVTGEDEWDDELGWIDVPAPAERTARGAAPAPRREAPAAPVRSAAQGAETIARPDGRNGAGPAARDGGSDAQAPLELEDDDWQVPPPPVPARPATSPDGWARAGGKRRRGPLSSPVVLLAIYSIGGIALIVLAVNLLSGSFGAGDAPRAVPAADRQPAAETAPVATATPAPAAPAAVSDFELGRREAAAEEARAAAIAAAERAERAARTAERRRIARERRQRARERAAGRAPDRRDRRDEASPPASDAACGGRAPPPRLRLRPRAAAAEEAAAAPVSSASAEPAAACPRLDALPARELPGGLRVARAERRPERMKGLAKLDAMPANYALHIPRCRSVHTFTMRFPLDLIWLGKDGRPVRVDRAVPAEADEALPARALSRRGERRHR